jgi:hypothetical protein
MVNSANPTEKNAGECADMNKKSIGLIVLLETDEVPVVYRLAIFGRNPNELICQKSGYTVQEIAEYLSNAVPKSYEKVKGLLKYSLSRGEMPSGFEELQEVDEETRRCFESELYIQIERRINREGEEILAQYGILG